MVHSKARSTAARTCLEWKLLLSSARAAMSAGDAARLRDLVREDVDWNSLVKLASDHHVTPLLYRSLNTVCPDAVPAATLALLERDFSANHARNLALTFELRALVRELAAHGISSIPLKGPTLAARAYGGLSLRQAGDIDILVQRQDAVRARDLLLLRGYRPYGGLTRDQEFKRSHHFALIREVRPICVDIHWRLINDSFCFNLDEQILWRDGCSASLAGERMPSFPLAELLIYLCAHGTKHSWQRLSWVCDIAELIRVEPEIDWDVVMHKARAIGAQRMLSLGLILAVDLLGAAVPDSVERAIRADGTARALAGLVFEQSVRETNDSPGVPKFWSFNVRARERLRDRLMCRLKVSVPAFTANERDVAFLRLPPHLSFLYYAVKPARLACEYALNPSGFLRMIGDLMGMSTDRSGPREGEQPDRADVISEGSVVAREQKCGSLT